MHCDRCGNEFDGYAGEPCPQCGHSAFAGGGEPDGLPPPPRSGSTSGALPGAPPPAGPPRPGIPWERERTLPALLETLKGVLLKPSQLFREADRESGIGPAFAYGLLLGLVGGYIGLAWDFLMGLVTPSAPWIPGDVPPEYERLVQFMGSARGTAVTAILLPVLVVVGLFLWSGIVHLILMMLDGASGGFQATFRTVGFASGSTALLDIVPICGGIIGLIWSLVIQINGLREMHGITGGKAAAAVLLPLVLCCCLCAGLVALVVALGGLAALTGLE